MLFFSIAMWYRTITFPLGLLNY